jgi:hypothetical protein
LPSTEQWEPSEDLLCVHHLARYELSDREGDDLCRIIDLGHHATGLCTGEPTQVGTQPQPDLIRVDCVDVEVDGNLRGAGAVEPLQQRCAGGLRTSGANTVSRHSSAIAGSIGSVQSCIPTSATRSVVVVAGRTSMTSGSP